MSFQTNMKSMIRWIIFLSILLGIVMVSFCSVAEETEIITGQETSPNYIPEMSEFTRSGGTNTGGGCGS